jgi:hypothetical protein
MFLSYVMAGAVVARKRYAALYVPATPGIEASPQDAANTKTSLLKELDLLKRSEVEHTHSCEANGWSTPGYRIQYCNCGAYKGRDIRIAKINAMLTNGTYVIEVAAVPAQAPSIPRNVLGWPGYLLADFVKAPVSAGEKQRATELAEARHNATLAELRAREAEALDKELALAKNS